MRLCFHPKSHTRSLATTCPPRWNFTCPTMCHYTPAGRLDSRMKAAPGEYKSLSTSFIQNEEMKLEAGITLSLDWRLPPSDRLPGSLCARHPTINLTSGSISQLTVSDPGLTFPLVLWHAACHRMMPPNNSPYVSTHHGNSLTSLSSFLL